ncbi:MAG: DNA methyltransferase [Alphaproteobacteria bacterium]
MYQVSEVSDASAVRQCGSRVFSHDTIESVAVDSLKHFPNAPRTHSRRKIEQLARSIERFGIVIPIAVDPDDRVVAGEARLAAAKKLGMSHVPVLKVQHLSHAEMRAYRIVDNRLSERARWDPDALRAEFVFLIEHGIDLTFTGFEMGEIDLTIGIAGDDDEANAIPDVDPTSEAVSRPGDVWRLGDHLLACGDMSDAPLRQRLLGDDEIDLVFTDPPYNVPIQGHVSGLGKQRHREFSQGSGEMSEEAFTAFLTRFLEVAAESCRDGAVMFVCMDWRHLFELLSAARFNGLRQLNLCVWNKDNGGMGSLYRSKHELVLVAKKGSARHVNNVELGRFGRNRTNVWDYAGVNSFGKDRDRALSMHPTVKPVEMIEDAIQDCSERGDLVFDPFAGSGSTIIAAERCGRRARAVEIDPVYCDTVLRRWEAFTGSEAALDGDGPTFAETARLRRAALSSGYPSTPLPEGDLCHV